MSTAFFNLRIDETLNDQLATIAAEEGRSKNKQIEYILKDYVKRYEQQNDQTPEEPKQPAPKRGR